MDFKITRIGENCNNKRSQFGRVKIIWLLLICLLTFQNLRILVPIAKGVDPEPTKTWDGDAADRLWSSATNWSDDTKPTSADEILIDVSETIEVDENISFASLKLGNVAASTNPILNLTNNITAGTDIIIENGATLIQNNATAQIISGALTVRNGGTLTHTANVDTQLYEIDFSAATVTVDVGGSINVDEKGYNGTAVDLMTGNGPGGGSGVGGGSPSGSGGGAHGGDGGISGVTVAGGTTYCDIANPSTIGSAGGNNTWYGPPGNGQGGGLILLDVSGTLTVNGSISANGGAGTVAYTGGGAGGGIKIAAGIFAGTPTNFSANGANAAADGGNSGGGGGGCVRVGYSTSISIAADDISVIGGTGQVNWQGAGESGDAGLKNVLALTPTAPTSLYSHSSNAQSGDSNPTNLTSLIPVFSAVCNTSGTQCSTAAIEVDDNNDFATPVWQSGSTDIADINDAVRSANISYVGGQLFYNTTYYWRIRFSNTSGDGAWSLGTDTFYVPRVMELYNFSLGGAVQGGTIKNIEWGSSGGEADETVKIEYSTNDFSTATTVSASETSVSDATSVKSYSWTIPSANTVCGAATCNTVKIRISSNNDGNNYAVTSESNFTIQDATPALTAGIKASRTFNATDFYTESDVSAFTYSGGTAGLVPSAWYNASWTKRKAVTVTNTGAELTNFPVQVDITYDADMQADFDDIRFTNSDEVTLIGHWFETKVDSTSATIWVEVPTIPASAAATIYMYYGNAAAADGGNGANVFEFFDNFTGSTIDTAKWDITDASGVNIQQNDQIIINDGAPGWPDTALFSDSTFARGAKEIRFKYRPTCSSEDSYKDATMLGWNDGDGTNYTDMLYAIYFNSQDPATGDILIYEAGADRGDVGNFTCGATYWGKIQLEDDGAKYYLSNANDVTTFNLLYDSANSSLTPLKAGFDHYDGGISYLDDFFIRQYAATEPGVSFGEEGIPPSSSANVEFAVGHTFTSINSFTATTSVTGAAQVKFQVSDDDSTTWKYCSGGSLAVGDNTISTASAAEDITDGCLSGLVAGTFNVRVFFQAATGETATVDKISFVVVTNVAPTVTDGNISIAGASGVGGVYKIGDAITVAWNNAAGGDNNTDIDTVTADFSQFGGGAAVAMTDTTACGGTNADNVYEACYTILGTEAIDDTGLNVLVTATDTGALFTTTADTTNASMDSIAPTNQNTVFAASTSKQGGASVTIISSGDATNSVWYAPNGTTVFSAGATQTTAAGDATSILTPANGGSYKMFVLDAAGNYSSASTATLTVDNSAPTTTISGIDISADTGTSATDFLTKTAAQTITATLNEAAAGTDIVYGSVDNGATWTDITSKVTGTAISWDTATLAGSSTIKFKVTDEAGNDDVMATTQAYILDQAAPTAPIINAPSSPTNDTTPTITGTGEAGAIVVMTSDKDGAIAVSATVVEGGTWSITPLVALSEDTHSLTVAQTDAAGNASSGLEAQILTIYTTAPTFTMQYYTDSDLATTVADNAKLKAGIYYLKISSSETLSAVPTVSLAAEGTNNDVINAATTLIAGNVYKYSRVVTSDAAAIGTVLENVSVTGTDSAGNTATDVNPTNEVAKAIYTDTTAPSFESVAPTASSSINNVTTLSDVSYSLSEAVASATITITRTDGTFDGSSPHTCTLTGTAKNAGAHANFNLSDTTDGCAADASGLVNGAIYTFVFAAADSAGNTSVTITRTSVTFDTTAPTAAITYSTDGGLTYASTATVNNVDTLKIKAVFSEAMADNPVVKLAVDNSVLAAVEMTKVSTTEYTYDLDVPVGDVATATVSMSIGIDDAGNVVTAMPSSGSTFSIDNTAPTLMQVTPVQNTDTNTSVSYTFSSDEAGTISYGGSCSSGTVNAVLGNTTVSFGVLSAGTYSNCTITVTDSFDNASTPLAVNAFTISSPGSVGIIVLPQNNPVQQIQQPQQIQQTGPQENGPGNQQDQGLHQAADQQPAFADTKDHWADLQIEKLKEKCGVTGYKDADGTSTNEYHPDSTISRAEFVKMFMQCKDMEFESPEFDPFKDVAITDWFAPEVAKAKEFGIITGFKNGAYFMPNADVTRAEAVKMVLLSIYDETEIIGDKLTFSDTEEDAWYEKYVYFALIKNIISGYADADGKALNLFRPNDPLTRAEAAKIIVNAFDSMKQSAF